MSDGHGIYGILVPKMCVKGKRDGEGVIGRGRGVREGRGGQRNRGGEMERETEMKKRRRGSLLMFIHVQLTPGSCGQA